MTPQELLDHNDNGELWPAHGGHDLFTDVPAAYQAALAVRALRIARGEIPRGFKVGFTNRNLWPLYNVFAPIWGSVWNTTLAFSESGNTVSLARLCQPRIEPEAVFCLKATPRANASLQDLFEALDWVAPGFEIVQSHLPGWKFTAPQTVADGGLHARLLVGAKVPLSGMARDAEQLHELLAGARLGLRRNGNLVEEGIGAFVLDSPLRALLHFLNELRACPGAPDLGAGDVVTTGTWTDAWPVHSGQTWAASFDSALHSVEVTFR
jgi:2-oxo-3-hexenedioate decarboxylase